MLEKDSNFIVYRGPFNHETYVGCSNLLAVFSNGKLVTSKNLGRTHLSMALRVTKFGVGRWREGGVMIAFSGQMEKE